MDSPSLIPSSSLTRENLLYALQSALSSDSQKIRISTQYLKDWVCAPGYLPLLQSIFLQQSYPIPIRHLAIIQIRNIVSKSWAKHPLASFSLEDRSTLCQNLIEPAFFEPSQNLFLENASVIAKIVRSDYPSVWPDSIPTLINIFDAATASPIVNPEKLSRITLVLIKVVKELSTICIPSRRKAFTDFAPILFVKAAILYCDSVTAWMQCVRHGENPETGIVWIEHSLRSIKLIRPLILKGFNYAHDHEKVREFWPLIGSHISESLDICAQISEDSPLVNLKLAIQKLVLKLVGVHLDVASQYPRTFVILPGSLDITRAYWSLIRRFAALNSLNQALANTSGDSDNSKISKHDQNSYDILRSVTFKGICFLRAILKTVQCNSHKYRHSISDKDDIAHATDRISDNIFSRDNVLEMINVIVNQLFCFTIDDLQQWEDDPEQWELDGCYRDDTKDISIRACSEELFLNLCLNFKQIITTPLIEMFKTASSPAHSNLLYKDSLYTAIGVAVFVLKRHVDFSDFIRDCLIKEVQIVAPFCKILRRRIAFLISRCFDLNVDIVHRALVYQIFLHLLNPVDPNNDLVVTISAARHLRAVVSDWNFELASFEPFAEEILFRLLTLLQTLQSYDTICAVLQTLSALVKALEDKILIYAGRIVSILSQLWLKYTQNSLMRQTILIVFRRVISAMKTDSLIFHSDCISIIKSTLDSDPNQRMETLPAVLSLWKHVIDNTPTPPPNPSNQLLNLIPACLNLLNEDSSEYLEKICKIITSYLVLTPETMLSDSYRKAFFTGFSRLFHACDSSLSISSPHDYPQPLDLYGCVYLCDISILYVRAAYQFGSSQGVHFILGDMVNSGFLNNVFSSIRGRWYKRNIVKLTRVSETCVFESSGRWKWNIVDPQMECDFFSILAYIAWFAPSAVKDAVKSWGDQVLASPSPPDSSTVYDEAPVKQDFPSMDWLLDQWFTVFDKFPEPGRRKMMCLGLTRLFSLQGNLCISQLQNYLNLWTNVILDLTEGDEDSCIDSLVISPSFESNGDARQDTLRERKLTLSDPVYSVNTVEVVKECFYNYVEAMGGRQYFESNYLSDIDFHVIEDFRNVEKNFFSRSQIVKTDNSISSHLFG